MKFAYDLIQRVCKHPGATTAVEFAILAPVFLLLLVGTVNMSLMLFTIGSMHYAVEDAARCASVKTTICSDAASTVTYAKTRFFSAVVKPTFSATAAACGNQVTATATYAFVTGVSTISVPLSATDCFP